MLLRVTRSLPPLGSLLTRTCALLWFHCPVYLELVDVLVVAFVVCTERVGVMLMSEDGESITTP